VMLGPAMMRPLLLLLMLLMPGVGTLRTMTLMVHDRLRAKAGRKTGNLPLDYRNRKRAPQQSRDSARNSVDPRSGIVISESAAGTGA
jgi:hypothetical protein